MSPWHLSTGLAAGLSATVIDGRLLVAHPPGAAGPSPRGELPNYPHTYSVVAESPRCRLPQSGTPKGRDGVTRMAQRLTKWS